MSPQIIIHIVLLVASFIGGVTVQSWRYGAKEAARVQQDLLRQKENAARDVRVTDNTITAEQQGVVRSIALRADANGSRAALVGLFNATDAALRAAQVSQAACLERAATLGELFKESTSEYRSLAETAGRHASDVQTLSDGWPTEAIATGQQAKLPER